MGLSCRIIKNNNGSLTVLNENGQVSSLYNGLVSYFSSQSPTPNENTRLSRQEELIYSQARYDGNLLQAPNGQISNLTTPQWTLSRTDSFLEYYGDWLNGQSELELDENGEPIFNSIDGQLGGLSEQSVRESLSTLAFNEGAQSKALLLWAMSNDPLTQERTGINENASVERVIEVYNSYGNARTLTSEDTDNLAIASESSDMSTQQLIIPQPSDVPAVNKNYNSTDNRPNYQSEEKSPIFQGIHNSLSDSNVLGTHKQPTLTDTFNALNEVYTDNVEVESDIISLSENLPQGMAESIQSNPTLQRQLYLIYRALNNVPVFEVLNGELVPKTNNTVRTTMQNTLYMTSNTGSMLLNLDALSSITEDIFVTESPIVRNLLTSIEQQAVGMNLDIVGLPELSQGKTYSEFFDYVNSLRDLVSSVNDYSATLEDINNYVNAHNTYFNITESELLRPVRNTDSDPLIVIEGEVNNPQLFQTSGVLHLYDNVYMVVNKELLLESATSEQRQELPAHLYEGLPLGSTALRQRMIEFFSSTQTGDSIYFPSREELAVYNMSRYLYAQEYSEQPIRTDEIATQLLNIEKYDNPQTFLDTFPSDFYNFILNQKFNGTELYNRLLKYFYVDDTGLQIRAYDYSVRTALLNWMSKIPNATQLYDYAALSQNQSLLDIMNYQSNASVNQEQLVYSSMLNPEAVQPYTGNISRRPTGEVKTDSYQGDVIKIDGELYKIVDRVENLYSNDLNAQEVQSYNTLPSNNQIIFEPSITLSEPQLEVVNNQIDQCQ